MPWVLPMCGCSGHKDQRPPMRLDSLQSSVKSVVLENRCLKKNILGEQSDTQGKSTSSWDMQGALWGSWARAGPSGLGG